MIGIEQAAIWFGVFMIAFPIYLYVTGKIAKSSVGKPTKEEQDGSGNTL